MMRVRVPSPALLMKIKKYSNKLKRSFFKRNTLKVSKDLIGCYLVNIQKEELIVGKITETEAYIGVIDSASHAYKKRTPRTEVQYGKPGIAYAYLISDFYRYK